MQGSLDRVLRIYPGPGRVYAIQGPVDSAQNIPPTSVSHIFHLCGRVRFVDIPFKVSRDVASDNMTYPRCTLLA